VIGTDNRLHYANDTARALFGPLHFGADTDTIPDLKILIDRHRGHESPEDETPRQEIGGRPYIVHTLVAKLPGEREACTILWLHCVAREDALFEQAVRDPLTGLYNRRYFNDVLARHVARPGRLLAFAYFDLDDFKTINDQGGHAAGDAALMRFVEVGQSQLRTTDVFARLGGDEFAVLFVNCPLDVAKAAIERIRGILRSHPWTFEGCQLPLGFSAGLAACHPTDTTEELLRRADGALYAAKESGKGRCAVEP
jgi:diguanylate cyclase (GGDEF)-like protein